MSPKNKNKKKRKHLTISEVWKMVRTSFIEFVKEDSFMHGAALAYYTIIALVPIIYLAITYFGYFVGQDEIIIIVGDLLKANIGVDNVSSLTNLMYQFNVGKGANGFLQVVGVIALVFTSTAMFFSLSKSLNTFFKVEAPPTYNAFLGNLLIRLISIGFMTIFGVIILVVYLVQSVIIGLGTKYLSDGSPIQEIVYAVLPHASILIINFLAFTFVFKYLHDGVVKWRLAMAGAAFTSLFLYLGQILVSYYLSNYFFAANGGVAGTLLAILAWIFYTSQIIFLGAKFMSVFARMVNMPIVHRKRKKYIDRLR